MFVVPAVLSDKYSEEDKKPYNISWAILGLLVFNWLLFLLNSYFLILIGIIVLLMFVVPAVLSDKYSEEDKKPYKISWAILGLLVFNWLLFLSNSYSLMPDSISDLIFTPIWVILSVAGIIVVAYE